MISVKENIEARCEACAWEDDNYEPGELEVLEELNDIMLLQDAGKPIEADALTDRKWLILRMLKAERLEISRERAKEEG